MNQVHHTDDHAEAESRDINGSQTFTTSRPACAVPNVNFSAKCPPPPFVFKSDVKSYYASMNHDILIEQLTQLIDDPLVLDLVCQYVRRTVVTDGIYTDVQQGIPLGCSLSPLMAAVYLTPLDEAMEKTGLFYARFMDDWVVFAPTRWKLRKVVRITNRVLQRLRVEKHPDKTFIGRVVSGFEFLGYHLKPSLQADKAVAQVTTEDAGVLPKI
jgi:retron-type reverse transcriptase